NPSEKPQTADAGAGQVTAPELRVRLAQIGGAAQAYAQLHAVYCSAWEDRMTAFERSDLNKHLDGVVKHLNRWGSFVYDRLSTYTSVEDLLWILTHQRAWFQQEMNSQGGADLKHQLDQINSYYHYYRAWRQYCGDKHAPLVQNSDGGFT